MYFVLLLRVVFSTSSSGALYYCRAKLLHKKLIMMCFYDVVFSLILSFYDNSTQIIPMITSQSQDEIRRDLAKMLVLE